MQPIIPAYCRSSGSIGAPLKKTWRAKASPSSNDKGPDGRRDQAKARLGQGEARGVAGDDVILNRDQPEPTTVGRPLNPPDHRLRKGVPEAQHPCKRQRLVQLALPILRSLVLHPAEIAPSAETAPLGLQHHGPQVLLLCQPTRHITELGDHSSVHGIVFLGPCQADLRHAACVDVQPDGLKFHRNLHQFAGSISSRTLRSRPEVPRPSEGVTVNPCRNPLPFEKIDQRTGAQIPCAPGA